MQIVKHQNQMRDTKYEDFFEIEEGLFLCDYDALHHLSFFQDKNIKHVLSVCRVDYQSLNLPNDLNIMMIPIMDMDNEDIFKYFEAAVQFIQKGLDERQGVLVHCMAGISRSASIMISYIMHSRKLGYMQAFALVKRKKKKIFVQILDLLNNLNGGEK